jgi:MSHA biogenesis protein MshL
VEKVARYQELVQERTHRQVDIEARIYEVTLNKDYQLGVDWKAVLADPKVSGVLATSSIINLAAGGIIAKAPAVSLTPLLKRAGVDLSAVIQALREQGRVTAISQPRLRSLNNQMAVIKVGTEQPFFNTQSGFIAGTGGSPGGTFQNTSFNTITVGTILSVTPQISEDEHVTLEISPVISSLVSIESSGQTTAPVLDIKQSSSLVRVKSGDTIVIGGLIQDKSSDTSRRVPFLGDIPAIGVPWRGAVKASRKSELVIFLTPRILDSDSDDFAGGPALNASYNVCVPFAGDRIAEPTPPAVSNSRGEGQEPPSKVRKRIWKDAFGR